MRLVLLGAPGAGKGTQAVRVAQFLNVPHISTGEIFRHNISNRTPIGIRASEFINDGELVPDDVTNEMVKNRLSDDDCKVGFVLDGYPRTIPQAEFLKNYLNDQKIVLDAVVDLEIDDDNVVNRITGRRVCPVCSENYHIETKKPKVEGICDKCSSALKQRDDDTVETVRNRLKTYKEETEPLIEYYQKNSLLVGVNGEQDIDVVFDDILRKLGVKND